MSNHIFRERDDEKKYHCLQADRELPVGERRKKGSGKYISEQQTQMCVYSAKIHRVGFAGGTDICRGIV